MLASIDISAAAYLFRVKGSVPKFAGWTAVYERDVADVRTDPSTSSGPPRAESRGEGAGPDAVSTEDEDGTGVLPPLSQGDVLDLKELRPEQKFTQPPPRYSEATLVKAMEENGIGRPSTYASIISVIQALVIAFVAAPAIIRAIYRIPETKAPDTVFTRGWGK